MNRSRTFTALTAVAALFMAAATVSAEGSTLSRADVRAELAEARAQGLMEQAGELATTDAVLQARAWANATQTRVLTAKLEVQQQLVAGSDKTADVATYTEAGADGQPVLVVLLMGRDGNISEVRSLTLATR